MDQITRDTPFVYTFIDDILVAFHSEEEHLQYLKILFQRLQDCGLSLKPSKCIFGVSSMDFLGSKVSEPGIEPLSDRVVCILKFSATHNPHTIEAFSRNVQFLRAVYNESRTYSRQKKYSST